MDSQRDQLDCEEVHYRFQLLSDISLWDSRDAVSGELINISRLYKVPAET